MAAGNIIQGQGTGKLGDVVLMVRNGVQVARVYTKAGARTGSAASEASRIQRVRFGAASNQWDLYKYVCTRMYRKGKSGNQSDYNYFVKRNQALLPYLTKRQNADGVHCLMPGLLSEGRLGRIEMVYFYGNPTSEGAVTYAAFDSQAGKIGNVKWSAKMSVLKAALRATYPAATKLTYLFSWAPNIFVEEEEIEFESQQVQHYPVHISLYEEAQRGEDDQTVAQYFAARFSGEIATFIGGQTTDNITAENRVFRIVARTSDEIDIIRTWSVTLFASDDNASECYTTIVPVEGVSQTSGPYALYFTYRTTEALRLACESYGYQSGVLRDDIAKFGNDLQQQALAYAARLRSLGVDVVEAAE